MSSDPRDQSIRARAGIDDDALVGRRRALDQAGAAVEGWSGTGTAGLALSGGGIRSATLSLGMLQAVARRGLISRFDYVSAVSGGGYIGGFFRSLFLPASLRGPAWRDPGEGLAEGLPEQHRFAEQVLASEPADREVDAPGGGERIQNPIWWLRQHSRYLAPNGPSDYASAASYLIRNWFAMLYVFVIAVASLFAAVTLVVRALFKVTGLDPIVARLTALHFPASAPPACPGTCAPAAPPMETVIHLSPWLPLAGIAVVAAFCCGLAYWMTENMRSNPQPLGSAARDDRADSRRRFLLVAIPTALVALVVGGIVIGYDISVLPPVRRTAGSPWIWIVAGGTAFIAIGVLAALIAYLKACGRFPNPTAEVRRRLTAWLTTANLAAGIFAAAGLVDSLALALRARLPDFAGGGIGPLVSTALIPAAAFAINRLSSLLGGRSKGGGIAGFLAKHMSLALLTAGILLYGAVAILVDAVVQALLWAGEAWGPAGIDPRPTVALALVLLALVALTGRSRGFINLSSLHQLYAARLTRAYLGASNVARLRHGDDTRTIREGEAHDHIEPRAFFASATTGPLPLLLATLNETIAPQSQMIERDRKGVPFLLGPQGVSVDRGIPIGWRALADAGAEALSMGQWCAISGASASAGMGRLTTLGGALTFTFANVRLGYWWDHGHTIARAAGNSLLQWLGRRLDTFVFLFDEMTARYSAAWRRVYLSDGGHFENSAAYSLLHRRVGVILLCDGGADLTYTYDDLEQLVRKARLDLRGEVEPVEWATVAQVAGEAAPFFLNAQGSGGWHQRIAEPASDGAFALLLRVRFAGEGRTSLIVWLKPRRLPTMAADVAAYARMNPDFPQQSTGDQFFDEAQWESYRKLGFQMTDALLAAAGPDFLDRLRTASGR